MHLDELQTELYALHDEVVHLLRQSAFLGLWFLVMREPLDLARTAKLWNRAAAEAVRSPKLLPVNILETLPI